MWRDHPINKRSKSGSFFKKKGGGLHKVGGGWG